MNQFVIALLLAAAAGGLALVLQRGKPDAPTQRLWTVPAQLDRSDFASPGAPWLVVVFSSATCNTCAGTVSKAEALASEAVAVQEVEAVRDKELHERYRIDAVPTLVIADSDGVVRGSFVGPVTATDLWATVAELREPGSLPEGGCDHGQS